MDGELIDETTELTYTFSGLTNGEEHTIKVYPVKERYLPLASSEITAMTSKKADNVDISLEISSPYTMKLKIL